jgi:hypothetical protein
MEIHHFYRNEAKKAKMKRMIGLFMMIFMLFCLIACRGNISKVESPAVDSQIYSQEEIEQAMKIIKKEFKQNWSGCTLKELYYAGDTTCLEYSEDAGNYEADEILILLSSFDVDASGGDGSFNLDSSCTNWKWILARSKNEGWSLVDYGY